MSQALDYATPKRPRRSALAASALACSSVAFAIGAAAFTAEGRFELPGFVWLLSLMLAIAGTLLSITGLVCLVGRIWMAVLAFVLSLGYWAIVGYGFCQMLGNL